MNRYRVGMYDRTIGNYSQWINVDFQAFNDGTVEAPITIENDSLRGPRPTIRGPFSPGEIPGSEAFSPDQ